MIKTIDKELYEIICGWWRARGWPAMPLDALSKRGYIVFIDDRPIVAGFLYKDETSCLGMFGWIISSPDSTHDERDKCLDELISHVEFVAKDIGITLLMTSIKHGSLVEKLKGHSFLVLGDGSIEMAKLLKKEI